MPPKAVRKDINPHFAAKTQYIVPLIYYNAKDQPFCSARSKRWTPDNPKICENYPVKKGSGRCKDHSGASTRKGAKAAQFKTGWLSKYMPKRLIEDFQTALNDPSLQSLEQEIALTEARLADLLKKADEGGASAIFKELGEAFESYKDANSDGDMQKQMEAMRRLERAISQGKQDAGVWREINQLLDTKRKLALAEAKRLQTLDNFITKEEANTLIAAIGGIIIENVKDADTLANISKEFDRILVAKFGDRIK